MRSQVWVAGRVHVASGLFISVWSDIVGIVNPTMTLDARQWQAAARALHATSSRTVTDFINGQAYRVALNAISETKRAEAAKIAAALGQVGTAVKQTTSRKTGKTRWKRGGRIIDQNVAGTLAAKIIGAMFGRSAFNAKQMAKLAGKTLEQQVRIFIGWRVRSATFIVSGWLPAVRKLAAVVYSKPRGIKSVKGAKQYGPDKGTATPAKFSLRSVIEASIKNTALKNTSDLAGSNPMLIATAGLQRALNLSAKDMMEELARRLQKDADKVNAR